jgi:hypothetical protein
MATLFDSVKAHFDKDEWTYRQLGDHSALEMGVAGETGNFRLVAVVDTERNVVRFLTFLEGKVPEPRRREVMEFLTRANYGLLVGNFEMDLADGEVRFKASVEVEDADLSYGQYQSLVYTSVSIMDRYFPGMQRVIQGSADPAAAVADVEH